MGTRGSVMFIVDGKQKGYYNHFDSYPGGLGSEVLNELKEIDEVNGWETFKQNVKKLKLVTENSKPTVAQQEKYKQFSNTGVSTGSLDEWYCLLRELQGAAYISAIMSGEVGHMIDGSDFIKDSLFCEYAYVINLDKMTLEFYKGFQEKPQEGNFFGTKEQRGYYPCAKVGTLALKGISKDELAEETMLGLYKTEDDEEE